MTVPVLTVSPMEGQVEWIQGCLIPQRQSACKSEVMLIRTIGSIRTLAWPVLMLMEQLNFERY